MSNKEGETILQVKNLRVSYKQNQHSINILDNLAFDLRKGEILALLGESGSGKSTIAKAVTGLLPPSAHIGGGALHLGSAMIADLSSKSIQWERIRGRGIAMLFQDAQQALNPVLSIKEHFKESLLFHRMASADEVAPISAKLLSMLNFTDAPNILDRYPFQLSGGMCQRICLALALCLKPAVLIADEPTSALDTVSQKEVLDLLKRMQEELGLTVLLITHDIAVANAISDRVIVLNRGVIEEEGDTGTVFAKPRAAYTRQLLSSRSRIAKPLRDRELQHPDEPLLEIVQLEKTFHPKKRVLHHVNLTLNKKEILGILGQSGCGKSTLAKCITGLESPSGGGVMYRGTDISRLQGKPKREICKQIQLVFQDARASLNPGRTALQLVQEPLQYLHIGCRKEREAMAKLYLDEVGITGEAQTRRPPQLSTGQCQRIAIARALVLKPEVLICDEAVSALDMKVQAQILALLQRLHKQFGFSILMISHDIRVLRSFCHHIAVMNDGSFSEGKRASARLHESNQPYTQLLLKCAGDMEEGLY
ncbi:ABC transporter ATP-binding protein [Paenibacillus hemerocallicola]|uniref:ABC transporter ATP-binding protein n=1 Tax=Paenibacillus hemerocallicola TaxID=1172614 RepID=A0A5C4T0A4_9BACL|nr:ABC transporter ATP-binding protein [Paenibacillus hemerocallicola]TNJ62502.1 ABC transporter ATP-binding protein [Paenibacillus hemerocallicola]